MGRGGTNHRGAGVVQEKATEPRSETRKRRGSGAESGSRRFSSKDLPPLTDADAERLLAAGEAGDVEAVSEILLSRNCAARPKLREQAVNSLIEARIGDYAERWDKEFSGLLHELGVASEAEGGFREVAGITATHEIIRDDAVLVSKFTMGESLRKDHKMTVPYLKERIAEGYKWALYRELEVARPHTKDRILRQLVGDAEAERLYRHYSPEVVLQQMDASFWHNMRQHWLKVRRGEAPRDPADATLRVLAQAGIE